MFVTPDSPGPSRRYTKSHAFSKKHGRRFREDGSFAKIERRRHTVALKQVRRRQAAQVAIALEKQIWIENKEKDAIQKKIVKLERTMDRGRRAAAKREKDAFQRHGTFAARPLRRRVAATPRPPRGRSAETSRGDAAAAARIFL